MPPHLDICMVAESLGCPSSLIRSAGLGHFSLSSSLSNPDSRIGLVQEPSHQNEESGRRQGLMQAEGLLRNMPFPEVKNGTGIQGDKSQVTGQVKRPKWRQTRRSGPAARAQNSVMGTSFRVKWEI